MGIGISEFYRFGFGEGKIRLRPAIAMPRNTHTCILASTSAHQHSDILAKKDILADGEIIIWTQAQIIVKLI
jgi:hypothetical protein